VITNTTLGDILLNVYDKTGIATLQNLESEMMMKIKESTDHQVGGNGLYFPVNLSGDEGYGFISEQAALPASQNEQIANPVVNPVVFVGAVKITGLARSISTGNALAFANGLQYHMDMKLKRMTAYLDSAFFRTGTGQLAQYAVDPADTAVANAIDTPGSQWIRRNMLVDIFDFSGADALLAQGVKVTDVDLINNTITLATNFGATVGDNDPLYLTGTHIPGVTTPVEIQGLDAGIATTGTYLTIDRGVYREWQSNVIAAAGADLDEDILMQAENRILIVSGAPMSTIRGMNLIAHPNQIRKYFENMVPQRQFTGMDFDAGYSKLAWNGKPFLFAHNCPRTSLYMGEMSTYQRFTAPGGEMKLDDTFGPVIKWAQGFDAGIAYWRCYQNYAMRAPNRWLRIDALADVAAM
jgi:hypothetical protein